jgi:N-formylglutamate amidohydrolase
VPLDPAERMTRIFEFREGDAPILVSIPHDGRELATGQAARMTDEARRLPDTDWHVSRLYEFAEAAGASVLAARYSRYVVDLNRPADDGALYAGQVSTGICPVLTFDGTPIYTGGGVDEDEKAARIDAYWRPYHEKIRSELDRLVERHGNVVLWDAHSIASCVPRLFDGELPALNLGTNGGQSCHADVEAAAWRAAAASGYAAVLNGRFRGGNITRQYGDPGRGVHAIQLELAQKHYMDEQTFAWDAGKASELSAAIRRMIDAAVAAARKL